MNEIVYAEKACCCGDKPYQTMAMVPAGSVAGGLSGCGFPMELSKLPVTYIRPQDYREGFCPSEALEAGTMFPELYDTYK